jgi:hypothetical protein
VGAIAIGHWIIVPLFLHGRRHRVATAAAPDCHAVRSPGSVGNCGVSIKNDENEGAQLTLCKHFGEDRRVKKFWNGEMKIELEEIDELSLHSPLAILHASQEVMKRHCQRPDSIFEGHSERGLAVSNKQGTAQREGGLD